eukprot:1624492-Alexandrium_andersonii.AAC.1
MSASLVGSEMCIRDRDYSVCRGLAGVLPGRGCRGCRGQAGRCGGAVMCCLLYTSDAADDM